MMRVVSIEVRRNTLLYAVVPIAGLWLWATISRASVWRGSWLSATSYAASATAVTVVLYCAIVGLDAARRSRARLDASIRSSSRAAVHVTAARLVATYLLTAVPAVVVSLVIWLMNRGYAIGPFVGGDQIVFAACSLIFAVALSGLSGVFTSTPAVGALCGIVVGGVISFYGDIPLSTAQDIRLASGRVLLVGCLALLALLAVLVLPAAAVAADDPRRVQVIKLVTGAVALASMAVLVNATLIAGPLRTGRPPPSKPSCSMGRPAVCVWPDHATYLSRLDGFATRASAAAIPALPVPATFSEFGLVPGRDATYAFVIQDRTPIGLWVSAGGMADTMLNAATLPSYCDAADQATADRRSLLIANVEYWLRSRIFGATEPSGANGESGTDTRQAAAVLRLGARAQRDWVETSLTELRSLPCAAAGASS